MENRERIRYLGVTKKNDLNRTHIGNICTKSKQNTRFLEA